MVTVSNITNGDGLWSVRDVETGERIALFYDDGMAREMVALFNEQNAQAAHITKLEQALIRTRGALSEIYNCGSVKQAERIAEQALKDTAALNK